MLKMNKNVNIGWGESSDDPWKSGASDTVCVCVCVWVGVFFFFFWEGGVFETQMANSLPFVEITMFANIDDTTNFHFI